MIRSKLARFAIVGVMAAAIPAFAVVNHHHKLVAKPAAKSTMTHSAKPAVKKLAAKKMTARKAGAHKLVHKKVAAHKLVAHKKTAKKLTTHKKIASKLSKKA